MDVFALIGPSGAGKTSALEVVDARLPIRPEHYVDLDESSLFIDNRSFVSKLRYMNLWCLDLIDRKSEGVLKTLCDRCLFDVCAYVPDQELQHAIVSHYVEELNSIFGVKLHTIYLRAPYPILAKRVASRLLKEPWRRRYHEHDDDFMRRAWSYYERHIDRWTHVVDNGTDLSDCVARVEKIVCTD